jgi:ABC-2 type transport system ATP-binding protein
VSSAAADLAGAMHAVRASGVEIDEISARQPNLDEVFLALTGHPRDAAAAPERRAA